MILDSVVKVRMFRANIKFYKSKYNCKVGDTIDIDVKDLSIGSSELVLVECDICRIEKRLMYRKYLKNISNQGYYVCSSKCSTLKKKKTCLINYGCEIPLQSIEVLNKSKQSCVVRYGFEYPMKSNIVKNKQQKTNIIKYGSNNYVNSDRFKTQMQNLYGVDNPMQSSIINNDRIKSSFAINEFKNIKYQGKYELDFLRFCKINSLPICKPDFSIDYVHFDKKRKYLPDFFLPSKRLLVEIKSTYYYELHKEVNLLKKEATIESGYNYILILDKDYSELLNIL